MVLWPSFLRVQQVCRALLLGFQVVFRASCTDTNGIVAVLPQISDGMHDFFVLSLGAPAPGPLAQSQRVFKALFLGILSGMQGLLQRQTLNGIVALFLGRPSIACGKRWVDFARGADLGNNACNTCTSEARGAGSLQGGGGGVSHWHSREVSLRNLGLKRCRATRGCRRYSCGCRATVCNY